MEDPRRIMRRAEGEEREDISRRRSAGFSGLTPEEEERRRLMEAGGEGPRGDEGPTMEDRIAREIEAGKRPIDVPGPTPAEQLEEMDRRMGRSDRPAIYSHREGPVEERPTIGEETARVAMGRGHETRAERGDLGRATGATYYYGDRANLPHGEASPGRHFGMVEPPPLEKHRTEVEPTAGERIRERGEEMISSTGWMAEQTTGRVKETGSQVLNKTRDYGRQIGERTREVTGGISAEELASQAGESLGRGIRKVMSVGSGIISGLRRGAGDFSEEHVREREGSRDQPESEREYRETEYREVRGRDGPKR